MWWQWCPERACCALVTCQDTEKFWTGEAREGLQNCGQTWCPHSSANGILPGAASRSAISSIVGISINSLGPLRSTELIFLEIVNLILNSRDLVSRRQTLISLLQKRLLQVVAQFPRPSASQTWPQSLLIIPFLGVTSFYRKFELML